MSAPDPARPGWRRHALADLSHAEFAARLPEAPVIALPLGSHEEQGPQAAMGDFRLAEEIALMACARADAIAAPVLPFGYAEFFRGMAGGMQLRGPTFRAVLRDMVDSFLDHGLERVVIVNGHSTNAPLIAEVAHAIRRETGVVVPAIHLWRSLPEAVWRAAHGDKAAAARGHGADPVTSVMMHLAPALVRPDRVAPALRQPAFGLPTEAHFSSVSFGGVSVDVPLDVTEVAANGVGQGDAGLASAAAGAVFTRFLVDHVAAFLAHFRRCDPRAPGTPPVAP
ncbi:MAG TPA: creatininase family protein [Novosphingobium sp.]|nr:creatininase family protein [Novosphingobium sp.]HZV10833.1 creatininase family protein [Novosphingobium sp.]